MIMDFLSEKFVLKSPSKTSDFYMGAGGTLEHVMETLDNESFYSKTPASKCVQAFNPLPRAEHHVRLERTSPCQDSNGESASRMLESAAAFPGSLFLCRDNRRRFNAWINAWEGERWRRGCKDFQAPSPPWRSSGKPPSQPLS